MYNEFPSEEDSRSLIVDLGNRLFLKGMVAANDGNLSVKINPEWIIATPTGLSKGYMSPEQMVKVNILTGEWQGILKPSTEIKMHREIYLSRTDVNAVVHAHPPYATAFSVAGVPLDKSILAEVIVSLGTIPIASYQTPSTKQFAKQVADFIKKYNAVLLANHGAVTVGKDLIQAHFRMETLEHYAYITWIVNQIGSLNSLNYEQVRELLSMREQYGFEPSPETCKNCVFYNNSDPEQKMSSKDNNKSNQSFTSLNIAKPPSLLPENIIANIVKTVIKNYKS